MLENSRYNRGLEANSVQKGAVARTLLLEEEYRTQLALERLHITGSPRPADVEGVGKQFIQSERIGGQMPFAIEVLGMPRSGKTTLINRYVDEFDSGSNSMQVCLVPEGADAIKALYKNLRITQPFLYSVLAGASTYFGYKSVLDNIENQSCVLISDRGLVDRRVFRRTLFSSGDVGPSVFQNESQFMDVFEHTPLPVGGVILMMIQPEIVLERGKEGPVNSLDFLYRLYEQYWRFHSEALYNTFEWKTYVCIDAQQPEETVYQAFKKAIDYTMLLYRSSDVTKF